LAGGSYGGSEIEKIVEQFGLSGRWYVRAYREPEDSRGSQLLHIFTLSLNVVK
jgi:hypothetical protein